MAQARLPKAFASRDLSRPLAIRVKTPLPWRIARALGVLVLIAAALYASYEWGRAHGRIPLTEGGDEPEQLQQRIARLQAENERLQAASTTSDSRIQVERSAQGQLVAQLKQVEAENGRLKEELAFYETLVPGGKGEAVGIQNLRVEPSGVPGEYRYRMLLVAGDSRQAQEFRGHLQLIVKLENRNAAVTVPDPKVAADPAYRLSFKRMQRIEGLFRVESGAKVVAVEVRVMEQGAAQPRASQNFKLS